MSRYDKFHRYLIELCQSHLRLVELLQAKLAAVDAFDIDKLDEIIKEEQVYVLMSKSFGSRIQHFRAELSLKGEKLREIIEELPEDERQRFRDIFKELKTVLDQTQALNQKCQGLLEERLYVLNKNIRRLEGSGNAPYAKPGAGSTGSGHHFLTKSV